MDNKLELRILRALKAGKISKEEAQGLLQEAEENDAPVVDEMHPDIGFKTRAVYKNFGNDSDASFNYLQKQHPELNFKKDPSGNVLAKKPGEAEWRRLDPSGFDMQDITDVAYDVPAGLLEGGAAIFGGITGGVAGTGVAPGPGTVAGALGGASVAGGATGAGLEALRQKIGGFAGIDQEVNMDDVKMAGAFGAASPLLLGTGAGVKALGKAALKSGMKRSTLEGAQRGLLGRGKSYLAPRIGEQLSGIPANLLNRANKDLDKIDAPGAEFSAVEALEGVRKGALAGQDMKIKEVGDQIGAAIDASEGTVALGQVKKDFVDLFKTYKKESS